MGTDRRLLVTGAGGQLGRALQRIAPDSLRLDRSALDVTDTEEVRRVIGDYQPSVVIHSAAFTKVDAAEEDPRGAEAVNVGGTRAVAAAADDVGAIMVYPSTDYVFDGSKQSYKEDDPTGPLSVYGRTKLEGERIVQSFERHLIVRTSWVFGDGHNFIRSILTAAAAGKPLSIVDDQRGRPTYAVDLAGGIRDLLQHEAVGVFHLAGGGDPCTWADLAEEALQGSAPVNRVGTDEFVGSRTGPYAPRPANSVLDCSKAAFLGVTLRPWREAVAEYVKELA